MSTNPLPVTQRHRMMAAARIPGDDPKSVAVRRRILAAEADDHPIVQGIAFYFHYDASRFNKDEDERINAVLREHGITIG